MEACLQDDRISNMIGSICYHTPCFQVYNDKARMKNLYTNTTEVDFRNYEVNLDTIIRVLTDRHAPGTARSRRLLSDETSNVLVYFTGHGGDEFMKIQVCTLTWTLTWNTYHVSALSHSVADFSMICVGPRGDQCTRCC